MRSGRSTYSPDPVKTFQTRKGLLEFLDGAGSKLVVLEFMAPWSFPSQCMQEPYREVASSGEFVDKEVQFAAVDFIRFQGLGRRLGVDAMPMFLLMHGRTVKDRFVALNKEELSSRIRAMLNKWDQEVHQGNAHRALQGNDH